MKKRVVVIIRDYESKLHLVKTEQWYYQLPRIGEYIVINFGNVNASDACLLPSTNTNSCYKVIHVVHSEDTTLVVEIKNAVD